MIDTTVSWNPPNDRRAYKGRVTHAHNGVLTVLCADDITRTVHIDDITVGFSADEPVPGRERTDLGAA